MPKETAHAVNELDTFSDKLENYIQLSSKDIEEMILDVYGDDGLLFNKKISEILMARFFLPIMMDSYEENNK